MIYLDVLDSVKTAHPKSISLEWWHPQTEIDQSASIAIAQADIMMRLLMGETISLANNQMIDSYAWLSLAEKMCELDEVVPWTPFNFVYYEKGNPPVTSGTLRKLMVDCFNNEKFEFSAWVNLDSIQKGIIVKNLSGEVPQFDKMLKGFSLNLDSDLEDKLQQQADSLQRIYEYLTKWEKRRKVCLTAGTSNKLIWPRMENLRNATNGIKGELLDGIQKLVGEDRLEYRSDIYKAIKKMDLESQDRERIQMYLDRFYNEKLSVSVSGGRGEFTMTDHTPDTTIEQDMVEDAIADKSNDPYGLLSQDVYDVFFKDSNKSEKKLPDPDALTWDDLVLLLKEEKDLVNSARDFQWRISQYYSLNPDSPTYNREYQNWLGKTLDQLRSHREILAEKLGKKVASNSTASKFKIKVRPWVDAAASGAVGIIVGTGQADITWASIGVGAGSGIATFGGIHLLSEAWLKIVESRAVGRYRTTLEKSINIKPDEELLR